MTIILALDLQPLDLQPQTNTKHPCEFGADVAGMASVLKAKRLKWRQRLIPSLHWLIGLLNTTFRVSLYYETEKVVFNNISW
jgi:hypothetical protein